MSGKGRPEMKMSKSDARSNPKTSSSSSSSSTGAQKSSRVTANIHKQIDDMILSTVALSESLKKNQKQLTKEEKEENSNSPERKSQQQTTMTESPNPVVKPNESNPTPSPAAPKTNVFEIGNKTLTAKQLVSLICHIQERIDDKHCRALHVRFGETITGTTKRYYLLSFIITPEGRSRIFHYLSEMIDDDTKDYKTVFCFRNRLAGENFRWEIKSNELARRLTEKLIRFTPETNNFKFTAKTIDETMININNLKDYEDLNFNEWDELSIKFMKNIVLGMEKGDMVHQIKHFFEMINLCMPKEKAKKVVDEDRSLRSLDEENEFQLKTTDERVMRVLKGLLLKLPPHLHGLALLWTSESSCKDAHDCFEMTVLFTHHHRKPKRFTIFWDGRGVSILEIGVDMQPFPLMSTECDQTINLDEQDLFANLESFVFRQLHKCIFPYWMKELRFSSQSNWTHVQLADKLEPYVTYKLNEYDVFMGLLSFDIDHRVIVRGSMKEARFCPRPIHIHSETDVVKAQFPVFYFYWLERRPIRKSKRYPHCDKVIVRVPVYIVKEPKSKKVVYRALARSAQVFYPDSPEEHTRKLKAQHALEDLRGEASNLEIQDSMLTLYTHLVSFTPRGYRFGEDVDKTNFIQEDLKTLLKSLSSADLEFMNTKQQYDMVYLNRELHQNNFFA